MGIDREATETHDAPQSALPPTIRVLTYNIKGGEGAQDRWRGRERDFLDLDHVATLIREHSPDIVSLQEIAHIGSRGEVEDQVRHLADLLGYAHAFAPVEGSGDLHGGESAGRDYWGNAVLSRFPILDHRVHELCWGRPRECRSLLETHLLVGTQTLTFAAIHLSYIWRTTFGQAQEASSILAQSDGPVILAGDMNAAAGSAELSPLHTVLSDAFSLVGVPFRDPRRYSFPNGPQAARDLDHIFVSSDVRVLSCRVLVDEDGVSDHNPVLAEVWLPLARTLRAPRFEELADDLLA